VSRVAGRFGLIGAAGEVANALGLCGWPEGASLAAAKTLFNEWLAARNGLGDAEDASGVACVRAFLTAHAESRFTPMNETEHHTTKTINRAGYREREGYGNESTDVFYILPEAWNNEVCKGHNPRLVAKAVKAMGALRNDKDRLNKKMRLHGLGLVNCYVVTAAIFGNDSPQYMPTQPAASQ
jgi:putative DNA primase/helicase